MARNSGIGTLWRSLAAVAVGTFLATQAAAQTPQCGARPEIVAWLEQRFGERPAGVGLIGNHVAVELHTSKDGTWTILTTDLTGVSCLVLSGHAWTPIGPPLSDAIAAKAPVVATRSPN